MSRFLDWAEAQRLETKLLALIIAGVLLFLLSQCPGPSDDPDPVFAAVDVYALAAKRATPMIDAAWKEAEAARVRTDSAEARAKRLEVRARVQGHRADSLAAVASVAPTATDSAIVWHAAYDARTAERDTLQAALDTTKHALASARLRGDTLARGLALSDSLRHRADSLLHAVVRAAKTGGCAVPGTFGLVACPSRKVAFVAGAASSVLAAAAWNNRDKIVPLLSLHR